MDTTDFICSLMRHNTDALGFITRPTIENRFVPRNLYVIQTNRFGKPIGYIIHGPVHKNGDLYIHQACIEIDRRNRGFGQAAVQTVITRATRHQARAILLRCPADLDAVLFWRSCGLLPTHISPGGARRRRTIVHFRLELEAYHSQPAPIPRLRSASC